MKADGDCRFSSGFQLGTTVSFNYYNFQSVINLNIEEYLTFNGFLSSNLLMAKQMTSNLYIWLLFGQTMHIENPPKGHYFVCVMFDVSTLCGHSKVYVEQKCSNRNSMYNVINFIKMNLSVQLFIERSYFIKPLK